MGSGHRTASTASSASESHRARSVDDGASPHETTPLLARIDGNSNIDHRDNEAADVDDQEYSEDTTAARSQGSPQHHSTKSKSSRIPTLLAITTLILTMSAVIIGVFFAPAVVEEYAKEALVLGPTKLAIESITASGVVARIQADITLDATRVKREKVRNLGRLGTWIAREVKTSPSYVQVYLPKYGNLLVGTASIPSIAVDIRDGHNNHINMLAKLEPGNVEGLRQVVNDWLEGRLDRLRVMSKTEIALKVGFIPLGTQNIAESFNLEGDTLPSIPKFNITRLEFHDTTTSELVADASLSVENEYPLELEVPSLGFEILVAGCRDEDPLISFATAITAPIQVRPLEDVNVNVEAIVPDIPDVLTRHCPQSKSSPLDALLDNYLHGQDASLFVRGSANPQMQAPPWMTKLLASVVVPVPFPGRSFDGLLRNFSLTDSHFDLPDPFADPNSEDANPRISGTIFVLAGLPQEMNFAVNVTNVRAYANVTYEKEQLGILNLTEWQPAKSRRLDADGDHEASLEIRSRIENAPLNITDDDVFTDVLQALFLSDKTVILGVDALVEVEVNTVLGKFQIKDLPAEGKIPVKPIATKGGFDDLHLRVGDLKVIETSPKSITLQALVNFTNPTEYTAHVPYFKLDIMSNGSLIGQGYARDVSMSRGENRNIPIKAIWDPLNLGGADAAAIGRELLSQYVSGHNTTLTLRTSSQSIPNQPGLGKALMRFPVQIPTPRLSSPGIKPHKDGKTHFVEGATFHLFSSTADFEISNPLEYSSVYIESINATAYYNGSEPVGRMLYQLPFKLPPGTNISPRIPVDWSLDSVGYEKVRQALGGTLRLDARGDVSIRLEQWSQTIWYSGDGIGAKISL